MTSEPKHLQKVCPVVFEHKDQLEKINIFAKKVFVSLGCRDLARIDFRVDSNGDIYLLELNVLPTIDNSNASSLVIMAEERGLSYEALIERLISPVMRRWLAVKQAAQQT
ncbi:unnamed protein product [Didymodactylos carnosus]|uniref:ATP-grasp domain-containing protein n=1 Tax=Didymodactylos carnosus TaxID=1234261 RepID=A0A813SA63_9BILA|nr:unnamed protein product [Didymodactylos carnosus]CAF0792219.1 unnamed protein product [Didymodactylos carnosus]CAF3518501.1 unnamed protein product [Didymodactylos carnosus]CAF3576473.1 unnamed protein product [Didymodactylos carnosus]